ncbi:hypothetical protein KJ966_03215 [bacterium]|nr:hypothetical protein [bacterium]
MELILDRFNLKRVIGLSKIAVVDEWRPYLLTGTIIGLLIFFSGVFLKSASIGFLLNIMLLAGIVQVSKVFSETHQKEKGIYYFMLPASIEEKYLVKLLSTLIGYYIFALLVCLLSNQLSILIAGFLYQSSDIPGFNPLQPEFFERFKLYLFFHSIFFAGSLFFRKNSFLKTVLVFFAVSILLTISAGSYLKNLFVQSRSGQSSFYLHFDSMGDITQGIGGSLGSYVATLQVVAFVVIPLVLYGVSFLKFKNSEIRG